MVKQLQLIVLLTMLALSFPLLAQLRSSDGKPWIIAPVVISNPSFGDGGGLSGMYFFRPDGSDNTSPSVVRGTAMYSNNDSYFTALGSELLLREDQHRISFGGGKGLINNEIDRSSGTAKFESDVSIMKLSYRYRWLDNWYTGFKYQLTDVSYAPQNAEGADFLRERGASNNTSQGPGLLLTYDSRDNRQFPYRGSFAELSVMRFDDQWGSDFNYDVIEGQWNRFSTLRPGRVLATRFYGRFASGDTSYSGKATLGRGSDLRGYIAGDIVGENLVDTQFEYRHRLTERWWLVGFAGVAAVYDGQFDHVTSDDLYGSGGLGLRMRLHPQQRVNFRVDYAWGEGDENDGFYVSLREAF
jgi:hemolysin activation/secretion protein